MYAERSDGSNSPAILVIDPSPDNLDVTCTALDHEGFTVICAATPAGGVRLARRKAPAVIVTELFQKTKSGWCIIDLLKRHSQTREIPIIAFSAYALTDDEVRALRSGAECFLPKPLPPSAVIEAVQEILRTEDQEKSIGGGGERSA
jgi:CheY-like chemotaxis protein